jgi:type II secretory pathway component PulF
MTAMEAMIVVLGTVVGGIVISMYSDLTLVSQLSSGQVTQSQSAAVDRRAAFR